MPDWHRPAVSDPLNLTESMESRGMAVVITVAQQKGGTGKTTLVANLAAALLVPGDAGRKVALLDIDPQKSLTRWNDIRRARAQPAPNLIFSDVQGWRLAAELDRLKREHDVVVIDSPPRTDTDARLAIRGADIVLVPLQPSPPDLWAAEGTVKLIADERGKAAIVLNRVPPTSKLRDSVVADIRGRGWPLMTSIIGNRTGFANAFAEGLGVTEAAPRSVAAAELRALLAEILEKA
jgi:chromosome partitioning protein